MINKVLLTMLFLVLVGCGIGGQYMNGLPPSKMKPYIPQRDYWVLEGGGSEQLTLDWLACGGTSNGGIRTFNLGGDARINNDILAERHAEVQRCMLKKGYQYIGGCTEYNKHWPACSAP